MPHWEGHYARCGETFWDQVASPSLKDLQSLRERIEPWLASLMQSEHLTLLVGNGLTTAAAKGVGATPASMTGLTFTLPYSENIKAFAAATATQCDRGEPNLEDDLRAVQTFVEGLRVMCCPPLGSKEVVPLSPAQTGASPPPPESLEAIGTATQREWSEHFNEVREAWVGEYASVLTELAGNVLETERQITNAWENEDGYDESGLHSFLLSFANRPPSRDRLEVFTTNYDRLLEDVAERLGLRIMDRFVGTLTPRFRSSRLSIDVHYDPPGMRGEPRYLEGVIRLTKLHGSLDWRWRDRTVVRSPLPFGPDASFPALPSNVYETLMIYPNAAKDVETLAFPYAELFRDLAAALCRPNVALFIYGYSFGDDHINRIIREMLTISSTHLIIVSYDNCNGRLQRFCESLGREDQITVLLGSHFGHLRTFVDSYLPRTLIEPIRQRRETIREARGDMRPKLPSEESGEAGEASEASGTPSADGASE